MVIRILEEQPVSLAKVKKVLDGRAKKSEATYEQKQTMEYVKAFSDLDEKKADELVDKLIELGIERKQAVKIADFMPKDKDDMKLIFSKVHYSINDDTMEKVFELVRGYE